MNCGPKIPHINLDPGAIPSLGFMVMVMALRSCVVAFESMFTQKPLGHGSSKSLKSHPKVVPLTCSIEICGNLPLGDGLDANFAKHYTLLLMIFFEDYILRFYVWVLNSITNVSNWFRHNILDTIFSSNTCCSNWHQFQCLEWAIYERHTIQGLIIGWKAR